MNKIHHFLNEFRFKVFKRMLEVLCLLGLLSCESFLDIEPPRSKVATESVFKSDVTAVSAMTGIYHDLAIQSFASGNFTSAVALGGMSADELQFMFNNRQDLNILEFEQNNLSSNNPQILSLWQSLYKSIYQSNSLIEGVANSTEVSAQIKDQLTGEALFIRAFCHFYLVNFFGDVPIITSTDYKNNALITRNSEEEVYRQIVNDLVEAKGLLSDEYYRSVNLPTTDRVRVNRSAAAALLARVYLYMKEWSKAELESSEVISNSTKYALVTNLGNVFLKNSNEAIWQLMPVSAGYNTFEGYYFIIATANSYYFVVSDQLRNSFEAGDGRYTNWIGRFNTGGTSLYFPYKYKVRQNATITEYSMVLRLAEQFLIRAEARVQLDNIPGAQQDINAIRNRAGLSNVNVSDRISLLTAIEHERQVELFAEWSHRWLDLKRLGRADALLNPIKTQWNLEDKLYPVPQSEFDKNPMLGSQNLGY